MLPPAPRYLLPYSVFRKSMSYLPDFINTIKLCIIGLLKEELIDSNLSHHMILAIISLINWVEFSYLMTSEYDPRKGCW
jgi:hypothetical protein